MTPRYSTFWALSLASNVAAAAQTVAIMWQLGDAQLSPFVIVAYQTASAIGTLLGVAVGLRLNRWIGLRRTLAAASILEALACLLVAITAFSATDSLDDAQGYVVAMSCGALFFAASIGGPAWIAIVAQWPGSTNPARQLLLDSIQSQLGRFVGPLLGGVTLAIIAHSVQWLSALNALSFCVVALLAWRVKQPTKSSATDAAVSGVKGAGMTRTLMTLPGLGLVVVAVGTDTARTFLSRFMQIDGQGETYYAWTVATLSFVAAAGAFVVARIHPTERWMSIGGIFGLGVGLLIWGGGSLLGAWTWVVGAALVGASAAVASAGLTALIMSRTRAEDRGHSAASAGAIRQLIGPIGTLAVALVTPVLGTITFAILGVLTVLTGTVTAVQKGGRNGRRSKRNPTPPDAGDDDCVSRPVRP